MGTFYWTCIYKAGVKKKLKPFCDMTCKKKDQIFWLFLLTFDSIHVIVYRKTENN